MTGRNARVVRPPARARLLAAFADLVTTRRYETLAVADLLARSGVARSTFYEQFRGLDDLLRTSVAGLLDAVAAAAHGRAPPGTVEGVLHHLWAHRDLARALLRGTAGAQVARVLRERLLAQRPAPATRAARPRLAPELQATQVAAAQLALLAAWLGEEHPAPLPAIAHALRRAGSLLA